jgi:integrase
MPRNSISSSCVSIHPRGYIYARVLYYDSAGNRKEWRARAENKTAAKELIRDFEAKLKSGGMGAIEARNRTFAQVAAEYERVELVPVVIVDGHKVGGKKNIHTPRGILKNVLIPYFGEHPIQGITRPDIEEFRRERFTIPTWRKQQRTIRTVNYELAVLRQVFYFAASKRWLDGPPQELFRKLISPASETKRDRLLTADEQKKLIQHCQGPREHIRPLVIAALDTTLRKGNLISLTWADVDFNDRVIRIKKTSTKTEQAVTIGLTRRLEVELRELWALSDKQPDTRCFGIDGDFKKAFAKACLLAKIENLRFHDLRAAASTGMVMAGLPEEIVRKATGHARAGVLRDHYIRADVIAARHIAETLDRIHQEEELAVEKTVEPDGYVN